MGGKQEKKTRQAVARKLRGFDQKIRTELEQMLKPAPKWCPDFIWFAIARVFLNI